MANAPLMVMSLVVESAPIRRAWLETSLGTLSFGAGRYRYLDQATSGPAPRLPWWLEPALGRQKLALMPRRARLASRPHTLSTNNASLPKCDAGDRVRASRFTDSARFTCTGTSHRIHTAAAVITMASMTLDLKRYPILIVDDEQDNLDAFRFNFRSLRHRNRDEWRRGT